ncbi:MAG TPA: hypothetical protein DCM87_15165 [Planctomycetes bacterium]|nr:hypothetical protein [Planctomycetota bacterium]
MRILCLDAIAMLALAGCAATAPAPLERIAVGNDRRSFVRVPSGEPFVPWGFNYDHDRAGRLLEDYWDEEWPAVVADFGEMRLLGANTVRIHLQLGKFMSGPAEANGTALARLGRLVALAERSGLYLDITGLGCYHKRDVPAWYDALSEKDRWRVQARFWDAVAARCAASPAIFCYDLMNEPVAPAGAPRTDWLGPPFAGKHFVQFIALDQGGRDRTAIAREWIGTLVAAIRARDARRLITVGLVPWSLDRPGLTSGFVPARIADGLDFLSVHIYPEKDTRAEALDTLRAFAAGKPVLIEEIFPLRCSPEELEAFIDASRDIAAGWLGFYWGATPEECRASGTIGDAITAAWLDLFVRKAAVRGGA